LGPLLIERLQAHQDTGKLRRVELLTDFHVPVVFLNLASTRLPLPIRGE
jgi:hypothetical protein